MLMVSSLAVLGSRKDLKREMSLAKVFGRGRQLGGGGGEGGLFFFFFGVGKGGKECEPWGNLDIRTHEPSSPSLPC